MDFVAIDFETANEKRNSACALGIVVVKQNKIVEKKYWLIKPFEMRFVPMNIWIHGITEEDVKNELTMEELWNDIRPYLENNFVVAHNAAFDMSVIRKTLDAYHISYPEITYSCTMLMARNHYRNLKDFKLNTVAKYLGIEFKHHHAGEDAAAAAQILIKICEELKIENLKDLSNILNLKFGRIYDGGYVAASSLKTKSRIYFGDSEDTKEDEEFIEFQSLNSQNIFENKTVVFTGPLQSMTRAEAMKKIVNIGGRVGSSVTKKTNYLITGIKNLNKLSFHNKSSKLRKAEMLIENGQDLIILGEEEFLKNL